MSLDKEKGFKWLCVIRTTDGGDADGDADVDAYCAGHCVEMDGVGIAEGSCCYCCCC